MKHKVLATALVMLSLALPLPSHPKEVEVDSVLSDLNKVDTTHWTVRLLGDWVSRYPDEVRMMAKGGKIYQVTETRIGSNVPVYSNKACDNAMDWFKAFREELVGNFRPQAAGGLFFQILVEDGKVKSVNFFKRPVAKAPAGVIERITLPNEVRKPSEEKVKASILSAIGKTIKDPNLPFPSDVSKIEMLIGLGDTTTNWWQSDDHFSGFTPASKKEEKKKPAKTGANSKPAAAEKKQAAKLDTDKTSVPQKHPEPAQSLGNAKQFVPQNYPSGTGRLGSTRQTWQDMRAQAIQRAQDHFEKAKDKKDSDPSQHIASLMGLANAYRYNNRDGDRNEAADKYFDEAVQYYKLKSAEIPLGNRSMWHYLREYPAGDKFDQYFDLLLGIAEDATKDKLSDKRKVYDLNGIIFDLIRDRKEPSFNKLNAWRKVIKLREEKRGKDHPSLSSLLNGYSNACEDDGDLEAAEQALLRATALSNKQYPSALANSHLSMAEFYLRNRLWDKAKASWMQAERIAEKDRPDDSLAERFGKLINYYQRNSNSQKTFEYVDSLLAMGGAAVLLHVDPFLEEVVNQAVKSGDLPKAETWTKKRLQAAAKSPGDSASDEWKMKLSEIYLRMGKTADSNAVFDELIKEQKGQISMIALLKQRRAELLKALGLNDQANRLSTAGEANASQQLQVKYALFGIKEVRFGHNTSFEQFDSADKNSRHSFGDRGKDIPVGTLGNINIEGNFSFEGLIYGNVMPKEEVNSLKFFGARLQPAPTDLRGVVAASIKPPASAKKPVSDAEMDYKGFPPGDYVVPASRPQLSRFGKHGPTRVYLIDDGPSENVIQLYGGKEDRPADLQIFYMGTKRLKVNNLSAILHAPNATVEIPHNGDFTGAIVGSRIVGESNNRYKFDKQLLNLKVSP